MGYTTDFSGQLELTAPATPEQVKYINTFSGTRRMKRDVKKLLALYGGDHGLKGEYGIEGEYFCKDDGDAGQKGDESILDYNTAPKTQPGLWCQWVLSEDGTTLEWDGGEKFYEYIKWLEYLIKNFFKPWGIKLNGEIQWRGESFDDNGIIVVKNNKVTTRELR